MYRMSITDILHDGLEQNNSWLGLKNNNFTKLQANIYIVQLWNKNLTQINSSKVLTIVALYGEADLINKQFTCIANYK
jgi:hypothetical protein